MRMQEPRRWPAICCGHDNKKLQYLDILESDRYSNFGYSIAMYWWSVSPMVLGRIGIKRIHPAIHKFRNVMRFGEVLAFPLVVLWPSSRLPFESYHS